MLQAKVLSSGGNVLLLDEPTNDLDVDTLRALEDALLEAFPGCAVVISHDRWFLDRIATHVLAFEGESEARVVGGELQRLRGGSPQAPRGRRRPAAPPALQAARPRQRQRLSPRGPGPRSVQRSLTSAVGSRAGRSVGHQDAGPAHLRPPDGIHTMQDERVPNVSRCTQLVVFGRSSPSGLRWSARTRRKASATSSPSGADAMPSSASRTRSTFGEVALLSARFSTTWIPGGSSTAKTIARAGEVDEEQ